MSLLDSFTKRKQLNTAINQTAKARNSEGKTADQLYKSAYNDYAEVLVGDALRSEALYNWGFALLHQAKTKTDKEAIQLTQNAISKFSACLLLKPDYLAAAIDGGVAYMELARLTAVASHDELYELAKSYFEKANAIQAGSASYNLACIYGLRNEGDACLKALETAKNKGSLPNTEEIINDPDLDTVKNQPWFIEFIATLETAVAVTIENSELATQEAISIEPPTEEAIEKPVDATALEPQTTETASAE